MPTDIKAYRVFIASPGGLETERAAFEDVFQKFNVAFAIRRDRLFIPDSWERTLKGSEMNGA